MRIAFASYQGLPRGSPDDALALSALSALSGQAQVLTVPWDRAVFEWQRVDAVVIRSCWNYHLELPRFLNWISRLEDLRVPLVNSPRLIRWNADKVYLRQLEASGIQVVPTRWTEPGKILDLGRVLAETDWRKVVIKPTVGASSHQTFVVDAANLNEIGDLLPPDADRGSFLVQPLLDEIMEEGEWSLIFFGGRFSHAVLKRPRAGEFRVQSEFGGSVERRKPGPSLVEQAAAVLAALPERPVYARVDGIVRQDALVLMELELIEPQLFLGLDDGAPARFARCLLDELRPRDPGRGP